VAEFEKWAHDCAGLARAVCMAKAFAELERERVNAYIRPIFDSVKFTVAAKWSKNGDEPERILNPDHLYLSDQEAMVADYFAECDHAHRAHGFRGEPGHCPALEAAELQRIAENALIDLARPLFGFDSSDLFGELRTKALDLLLGACLKAERDRIAAAPPYSGRERRRWPRPAKGE
jgi:hypothetical protein